jgi:hypothetical protein
MKKEYTINYQKHWDKDGTCYSQTVNISQKTLERLKDNLQCHIVINSKKELVGDEHYKLLCLKECFGELVEGIVFMNLTQRDFFNKYLKFNLKDRNTCFCII